MIPVLIFLMLCFGITDIVGTMIALGIALIQFVLFMFSKTRTVIHDKLAHTICVDFTTQIIFDTPEALIEYKKKRQAELAERADY